MIIKRMNMDLGNSLTGSLINGNSDILEIPTAVVEVSESQAKDYFPDKVERNELRDSLLLEHGGEYYLVGTAAEMILNNDSHIGTELHDKSSSIIPYIMFLASVAVYDAENNTQEDDEITIEYFSTMLPIFELLESDKFSTALNEMTERFNTVHQFQVVTNGCEKSLTVGIEESKCYPEGLTAKYALQYLFDLTSNPSSEQFKHFHTINVDLGGGTIDLCMLEPGLKKPRSRNDFQTITDAQYLGMIKSLRESKLRRYFSSARELESFIVDNYKNGYYAWVNGKTGEREDLTDIITEALRDYTNQVMKKILGMYPRLEKGQFYKYNYFGGVAPILRGEIRRYLAENFTPDISAQYHHIEPDHTARFLNLYGLEIISRQNTLVDSQN